ncbi:hypothetical protein [Roseiconus lacunae]|uniref:Uncharacterized protein n=1 Tax=Roseiconus lacunae TaxID=2605694 RepID=A0ABT7PF75_9BACT|nr:hypothetical protein [Roseiconus lacunae]MDM4015137.1 hypothetical protein [Roseiconus lacunae]
MEIRPILILLILLAIMTGCREDKDARLVAMARRHEIRQAEQNVRATELQREVTAMQRAVQSERASINRERDKLEDERREVASSRRFDSLSAAAINNIGLVFACLLPLGLIWLLLAKPQELDSEHAIVELMLNDMVADQPLLFDLESDSKQRRRIDGPSTSDVQNQSP